MREIRKHIYPILAFSILLFLLVYKLFQSFTFHPDFARDIYDILTIVQGKMTLIGPKLSFGGIYSGPYYYLFAPIFFLTGLNLNSLLALNVLIFVAGLICFYYFLSKKYAPLLALAGSFLLAFLPIYVTGSRGPWNGSTYLPMLLVYLSLIFLVPLEGRLFLIFITGFLGGVIANIHLVSIPVLVIGVVYLFFVIKNKKQILWLFAGFALAFAPLVLFEVKHNFVMLKNTFLVGSYKNFVENTNIPNAVSGKKNLFENLFFLSERLTGQLGISPIVYAGVMAFIFSKSKFRERFLTISSIVVFILLSAVLKYQFGAHYLYPVALFIAFSLVLVVMNSNYRWIMGVIIAVELLSFPFGLYKESSRVASTYKKRVEAVIEKDLVNKNESFNIIQVSKDYTIFIPVGHEYRFFFRKNNFIPKSEFEYNSSDKLLVFSELKNFNLAELDTWEIKEFGKENIKNAKRYPLTGATLYVITKNK